MQRLSISTEKLFDLYSSGLSAAEVAERVGCSTATVKARFRREGISMRPLTERTERWYGNIAKARQGTQSESRMEGLFREQFATYGVTLVLNHPVGRWNVDLAHLERKIAFEIDTGWHRTKFKRARDKRKDVALTNAGWTVVRIPVQPRYSGKILVPRLCEQLGLP